jgi:hypothetical protein
LSGISPACGSPRCRWRRRTGGALGVGIEAAEEALAIRRALAAERPEAFTPQVAGALGAVAAAYADRGHLCLREAVGAAEDGVAIRRPLYEANPVAYHKHLSEALTGLSIYALAVGLLDAGLAAGEEAVMIDAKRERGAKRARMALAMNFVARKLNDAGQPGPPTPARITP